MSAYRASRYEVRPTAMLPGEVGLFATVAFGAGERVIDSPFYARMMPHEEFELLPAETRAWIVKWCLGWPEGFVVPEASDSLSLGWFMNHHCDGNVGCADDGTFVALRAIAPGEELVYDYALCEVIADPMIASCVCGGIHCRGRISGRDWRDDDWWRRQGAHAHPVVRRLRAAYDAERERQGER